MVYAAILVLITSQKIDSYYYDSLTIANYQNYFYIAHGNNDLVLQYFLIHATLHMFREYNTLHIKFYIIYNTLALFIGVGRY